MSEPADSHDEITIEVVSEQGGAVWQACLGGYCVRSGSGARLMELLAAMLRSRGVEPPLQR
jgi:hypothetical protein